jgi:hypothetical protein
MKQKNTDMKKAITIAFAGIIAIHLFGQHTSEKVRIKNDIRNDLTELESIYLDKLSYREGKRAEIIVDNIMESVNKLTNERQPHAQPEHSVNRRAERGISEEEFQAMLGNLEKGFHDDMHYSHYRFDPAVYCLSAGQMDELVRFFSGSYVTMLSPGEFNILKKETDQAFPDSEKQLVIAKKAIQYYFTVDQVILLLEKFSFDKSKIALIDLIYPKIVDKEMSYRLFDTLTFSSSKDELRKVIDRYMGR